MMILRGGLFPAKPAPIGQLQERRYPDYGRAAPRDRQGGTSGAVCLCLLQPVQRAESRRHRPGDRQNHAALHPRRHKWSYHFRYKGGTLTGRTAIGRTTIDVLQINRPYLLAIREILIAAGVF